MYCKLLTLILICGSLSACALFGPNLPHANIKVQAAKYLNPDVNGKPSPIVVTLYELKNPFTFKQASYDALIANSAATLGHDLIDQQTVEIRPASYQIISQPLSANAHYLGVVAAYRNIGQAAWHATVPVPANTETMTLNLSLQSQGLNLSMQ